ncbi:MAG: alpha/beta hydrolase domain-containing protein [Stellaceae bacterium]
MTQSRCRLGAALAYPCFALAAIVLFAALAVGAEAASVPNPTVSGPIASPDVPGTPTHNYPFFASNHNLPAHGYVEQEFYIEGTANRYNTPSLATGTVVDGGHAYRTRILVRRPADPKQFNGTVLVEWLNVTNGFDADNQWFFSWEHILKQGYAWVGVSAQQVGVARLQTWNPTRYGALDVTQGGTITGDALSYDIFSQAGQAVKHPAGVDPLGGLKARHVIAIGESQSAFRLATYVNSIDPLADEYDGFVLLSTLGNPFRTDLRVPVWKLLTEFDVENSEASVRQPDTSRFRTWEVAGSSHVDQHLRRSREPLELRDFSTPTVASSAEAILSPQCAIPSIGTRVPTHYVVGQAYDLMVRWITDGVPPPSAPRIQIATFGAPGTPSVVARDSLGLAEGGIRLPELAVPTAENVGVNSGPGACVRWGYSAPFDVAKLDSLYRSHDAYVDQVVDVANDDVRHQYIDAADAQRSISKAVNSAVGGPGR